MHRRQLSGADFYPDFRHSSPRADLVVFRVLAGTPTQGGVYTGTLTASNSINTVGQNFTITVNQPPAITDGPPPATAPVHTAYGFSYTTSGYPAPSFSIASGALPPGLTLTAAGVVSGTPTTTGTYSGTVTAGNGVGTAATQNFTITVFAVSFNSWASEHFTTQELGNPAISGPTATPENDGLSNLLKYLYDIDPGRPMVASDLAALPSVDIDTTATPGTQYPPSPIASTPWKRALRSICKALPICRLGRP